MLVTCVNVGRAPARREVPPAHQGISVPRKVGSDALGNGFKMIPPSSNSPLHHPAPNPAPSPSCPHPTGQLPARAPRQVGQSADSAQALEAVGARLRRQAAQAGVQRALLGGARPAGGWGGAWAGGAGVGGMGRGGVGRRGKGRWHAQAAYGCGEKRGLAARSRSSLAAVAVAWGSAATRRGRWRRPVHTRGLSTVRQGRSHAF